MLADLHGAGEEAKIHMSFLSKLEAMASSSVRVAEKCSAKLIIVFTDTGLTAALVAKYRCATKPPQCSHSLCKVFEALLGGRATTCGRLRMGGT